MIAVIDYGVGNLFSLKSSFAAIGEEARITSDEAVIRAADHVVLPGVGAFRDAVRKLEETGMKDVVLREAASGKPFLGICLGMQLLFDRSFEDGEYRGLGLIPGEVRPIRDVIGPGLQVPHIGWNVLKTAGFRECPLFRDVPEGAHVYFVHSYAAFDCAAHTAAVTEYGADLTAAVQRDNVFGCQFHPEKSGDTGLSILKAFCGLRGGKAENREVFV
ncbi:MAG: imidazole glycerol phosphate synthase subunit HisH [Lachnospiraceae bacterium]|nr:imidazole glycerol phosphate synthase subunit HisH [Lachnospiraceae bacterium]